MIPYEKNRMPIARQFNERALEIWRAFHTAPTLMPAHYPDGHFVEKMRLLMLGINPAYNAAKLQARIMALGFDLTVDDVYGWHPETGAPHAARLLETEQDAFNNHQVFFGPQRCFAEAVGCLDSYSHLDLLHGRHTNMNEYLQSLNEPGTPRLFRQAQIDLTGETIRRIRPQVVVVANATASRLALEYMGLQPADDSGTRFTLAGLPETRFFLAGMLSGQRAMDTFSRIRLETDVKHYLATLT
ncbi:hypothetical protein [Massilia litorea]|uniref:Uncharacterized protein n=1 Tax=Massilia litorea TaxID=2769491 RepID=A0A7L9U0V7_9BURK|nr:hypothetical protein [Massilia litorea]QOL48537.1 hypothetical protein LPB04_16420 [Massilia litorea]